MVPPEVSCMYRDLADVADSSRHRKFPWGLSHLFLIINVGTMLACSFGVIAKRYPDYSVFGLLGVVVAQGELSPSLPCGHAARQLNSF